MIYLEYSNEVWNSIFTQTRYCNTQGEALNPAAWSAYNSTQKGWAWAGLRAAQISEIFRTVFGTDSGTRWVGVLGTQTVQTAVTDYKFNGVDYHIANDAGAASTVTKLFCMLP